MLSAIPSFRPKLMVLVILIAGTLSNGASTFAQGQKGRVPSRREGQTPKTPAAKPAQDKEKGSILPRITPEEQVRVDTLLRRWEEQTRDIKTLKGDFTRITYNVTFKTKSQETGTFVYKAPDKGKIWVDKQGDPDKWICDGEAILQFNEETKQVKRVELPPDLQGEHIRKGPMPFLFGMSANELRRRYWLKITKEVPARKEVWLVAYPLQRDDRANFDHADLILNTETFLPQAIRLHDPNGRDNRVYDLDNLKKNSLVLNTEFKPPGFGWKVIQIPASTGDRRTTAPPPKVSPPHSRAAKRSSIRK